MKKTKAEVDYSPGHKDSHCGPVSRDDTGSCKSFRTLTMSATGSDSCVKVLGGIKRMYWCKLYEKA